jgi:hypothetical protein
LALCGILRLSQSQNIAIGLRLALLTVALNHSLPMLLDGLWLKSVSEEGFFNCLV